jgi:hypothetical protein
MDHVTQSSIKTDGELFFKYKRQVTWKGRHCAAAMTTLQKDLFSPPKPLLSACRLYTEDIMGSAGSLED